MSEEAIQATEPKVITTDLVEIKAYDKFSKLDTSKLPQEDATEISELVKYIKETGVEAEIDFTDDRLLKIWYAIMLKHESAIAEIDKEDWILLIEYVQKFFKEVDADYSTLITTMQSAFIERWGSYMNPAQELSEDKKTEYQLGQMILEDNEKVMNSLPTFFRNYVGNNINFYTQTEFEKHFKDLHEILKAA